MATLGDMATKARALTHSDTTSYTDANLLIDINIWYRKVVSMIFESQDDSDFDDLRNTTYPIVTTPLVAAQRDYSMPVTDQVLKIKRVDIAYNGVDYFRATPFDSGAVPYGMGNATSEDLNMIKQAPQYDPQYNSIFIYPLPTASDVSSGAIMRVQWERDITAFTTSDYSSVLTDSTVVPGFDAQFHPILAYGAAFEFAVANNLPQLATVTQQLQDWEARLRIAYGHKDLDTQNSLIYAYDSTFGR